MNLQKHFPWTTAALRALTGRIARRVYLALILLVLIFAAALHLRRYLLTRKIQAVLAGLQQIQIDQTTEDQLWKTLPYLVRSDNEWHVGTSTERFYYTTIATETNTTRLLYGWPERLIQVRDRRQPSSPLRKAFDWLGYRYFRFDATIVVLDGKVSSIRYGILPDLVLPPAKGSLISVRSIHGLSAAYNQHVWVNTAREEDLQFQLRGDEHSLQITYTFDAPREQTARPFQLDLSCLWGLRPCASVSQVAPLLWQQKQARDAQAAVDVNQHQFDCPDRMLAARVRYIPNLAVQLLEVVNSRQKTSPQSGVKVVELISNYRVREILGGHPEPWKNTGSRSDIVALPIESPTRMADSMFIPHKPGDRFLFFSGEWFDRCKLVPATPAAEAAVRTAVPAPKREEDMELYY